MAVIRQEVLWGSSAAPGLDHLRLEQEPFGWILDGMALGVTAEESEEGDMTKTGIGAEFPYRLLYQISCDRQSRVRQGTFDQPGGFPAVLRLKTDGAGNWENGLGQPLPELEGCLDLTITGSALGPSLAVRRLKMAASEEAEILLAQVTIPALTVQALPARLCCLTALGHGAEGQGEFTFHPEGGEKQSLVLDSQGLLREGPGPWQRLVGGSLDEDAILSPALTTIQILDEDPPVGTPMG